MTLFSLPPLKPKKHSGTGSVLERSVMPALEQGGYEFGTQIIVGRNFTGRPYRADLVARLRGSAYLISCKWQQEKGTAEEKVCFEVLSLKYLIATSDNEYRHAYLILGGTAWTLRDCFMSDEFESVQPHRDSVTILMLEDFMALANKGAL